MEQNLKETLFLLNVVFGLILAIPRLLKKLVLDRITLKELRPRFIKIASFIRPKREFHTKLSKSDTQDFCINQSYKPC